MLKIGEFSKLMKISIRMLRYYDENELLKPAYIDEQSGYRMYGNKEVEKLSRILFLRDLGFSVEQIKGLLKTNDEALINERFNEKEQEMMEQIALQQKRLTLLRKAQSDYKKGIIEMSEKVVLKEVPDYWVVSIRKVVPNYYHEEALWRELSQLIKKEKLTTHLGALCFAIYHDGEYKEKNVDIEVCIVIDKSIKTRGELICRQVPGCKEMATLMVYGPFENIAGSYKSFVKWLDEHEMYAIIGCDRQITHRGPWNETDESQYLVELQIPVTTIK